MQFENLKKVISSKGTSFLDYFQPCSRFQWILFCISAIYRKLANLTSLINLTLSEADPGPPKHLTRSSL